MAWCYIGTKLWSKLMTTVFAVVMHWRYHSLAQSNPHVCEYEDFSLKMHFLKWNILSSFKCDNAGDRLSWSILERTVA